MMLDANETFGVGVVLNVGNFDTVELDLDLVTTASDFVAIPTCAIKRVVNLRLSKESL